MDQKFDELHPPNTPAGIVGGGVSLDDVGEASVTLASVGVGVAVASDGDEVGAVELEDEEEGLDELDDHDAATGKRSKRKRDGSTLRKAPQAPKRFKSSYICFFMAKQSEIKEELGDKATVTEISKRSAEMWRNLPSEERAHWDDVAAKDKQRYMVEKASYTGPWQVPWKRAKKDPSAPKRPMSAFLYFSQGRRRQIKEANPDMKNTEVSRLLGEMWRNASDNERKPHIDKEKEEREKYKVAIADWRKDYDARMDAERKSQAEQAAYATNMYNRDQLDEHTQNGGMPYSDQSMMPQYSGQHSQMVPPPYGYGAPPYSYPPSYPPGYQFPTNGKQPVILGPNGAPRYPMNCYNAAPTPPAVPMQSQSPMPAPYNAGPPPPPYEDPSSNQPVGPPHFDYSAEVGMEPQLAE